MLPALYRRISEESGIDFTYVSAGRADQQVRLAKNRQVEIVSAHRKGAVPGLKDETVLYRSGGDELCVGFTAIASDELVKTVGSALRTAPSDEIWRLSAENAAEPPGRFPHYLLFIIGGLLLVIAVLAVWLLKKRKNEQRLRENKLSDPLTGIGNLQYFERGYQDIARSSSSMPIRLYPRRSSDAPRPRSPPRRTTADSARASATGGLPSPLPPLTSRRLGKSWRRCSSGSTGSTAT